MIDETPKEFNRTRIAPTPSGFLHLGNVLSFAITAALAKRTAASILLRIDDLDRERANKLYIQDIFDTLNFLEIPWDEGPHNPHEHENTWSQVHRMHIYEEALTQLKDDNAVFACDCSRAQVRENSEDDKYPGTCRDKHLSLDTPNTCWRLLTNNADKKITINTLDEGPVKTILPLAMHDFIVRKKDGYPAYQLASVLDDLYFEVDLVVRGEDLWQSTVAQHYLSQTLYGDAFKNITFHHHSLLLEPGGNKLSKSAGVTSIRHLRAQGKKPADIYSEIGRAMGINEPVYDWGQLGEMAIALDGNSY